MEPKPIIIRTSDRMLFKRCRRKWHFQSAMKLNLEPAQRAPYFWIGTGGHFALEDYHGYNYYGHPVEAFRAYVEAQRKSCPSALPDDWKEQAVLGEGILDYYLTWLNGRDPLQTYWFNGEPQVEVRIRVPLPMKGADGEEIFYDATLDRVVEIDGELWVLDYKFYAQFRPTNLDLDEQITSYLWLASLLYGRPVVGMILMQFKKELPKGPRILRSGAISSAKNQKTTHRLYKEILELQYGEVHLAPPENVECLNHLAQIEGEERDAFIKREYTRRSQEQLESLGSRVLAETTDMTNPDIFLYPNFTRDCSWDCPFNDVCLMIERDEDWETYLEEVSEQRTDERDEWRKYLPLAGIE